MTDMTIGRVADVVGVGVETIRFYERRKLIEQPPRPWEGGYRIYSGATVQRLHFIRRAQALGFSLREIAELLRLRDVDSNYTSAGDVQRRATAKLHDVDQKIDQLRQIRGELAALVERCPGQGPLQCCSIFEALEHTTGPVSRPLTNEETGMQTVKLTIGGMHCNGCEEIVRHVLEQQTGVKGCSVSHETGEARVAIDELQVSDEQLAKAVREAGYSASNMNTTE